MLMRGLLVLVAVLAGCVPRAPEPAPPAYVLGAFADDYGSAYTVTERAWVHRGYARYRVTRWRPTETGGYLLAQNDAANPTDGGLWTRIDWVRLEGMPPYEWAFCLSAYDAPTEAAAAAVQAAQPEQPRTGCNGFPFSRMRRMPADSTGT